MKNDIITKPGLKFVLVKLFVLLLVNTVMFAASALLLLIFRAVTASADASYDLFYKSMIVSGVTGAAFLFYMLSSLRRAAAAAPSAIVFALREGAVYSLFIALPFVSLCIGGIERLMSGIICRFFLPDLFFVYAVKNVYSGILIQAAVYTLAVFIMAVFLHVRKRKDKRGC